MLIIGAWQLNTVALMMSWLPVLVFVIYPYTKRYTWLCHFWLGICLGIAPAGAWLAVAADVHGGRALIRGSIYICGGVFTTANFEDIIHARHDVSGHNALLARRN